jgi:thiamine pyrophosphate-dependent acetolactate synthase large subunit-like protein
VRAYRQFAQLIADAGARTVFGVMGDGNMHWVAAYRDLPDCRWYPAWHESGAVWMADGLAAVSGDVGVATVTMGPGLAQALPALLTGVHARRRLVLVTAALPDTTPPQAQFAHQRELVEAAGARYVEVHEAAMMAAGIGTSFASARAGVPAVLAVDLGVFESADATEQSANDTVDAPLPDPDPEVLDAAVAVLAGARAPLVLLGSAVLRNRCLDTALELGRTLGAVFGTTVGGRVALPDEPWDLGILGMMADPVARAIADSADVILVLGAALDRYNTDGARLGRQARVVRVDHRPAELLWSPSADTLDVRGDLRRVLAGLMVRLPIARATGLRTPQVRDDLERERARQGALAAIATPDGPNPWAVVQELDRSLPPDAHVVVGIGHFWYFVAPYLRPQPSRTFHFTTGFASIGQALPVGVGAALGGGRRPVVVVEGDGSAVMNVQEMQAAMRHGADLLIIVLDNNAYGSEYHKLALAGLDPAAGAFEDTPFDLVAVAAAMGATARAATGPDELRAVLRELVPMAGVRFVDARISASTMSEAYVRQHGALAPDAAPGSGPSHSVASTAPAPPSYRSR